MGTPVLFDNTSSSELNITEFFIQVVFGSASITSYRAKGEVVFTRTGAGTYTIKLPKAYPRLLNCACMLIGETGAPLAFRISSNAVSTTGIVTLTAVVAAGTATDPAAAVQGIIRVTICDQEK